METVLVVQPHTPHTWQNRPRKAALSFPFAQGETYCSIVAYGTAPAPWSCFHATTSDSQYHRSLLWYHHNSPPYSNSSNFNFRSFCSRFASSGLTCSTHMKRMRTRSNKLKYFEETSTWMSITFQLFQGQCIFFCMGAGNFSKDSFMWFLLTSHVASRVRPSTNTARGARLQHLPFQPPLCWWSDHQRLSIWGHFARSLTTSQLQDSANMHCLQKLALSARWSSLLPMPVDAWATILRTSLPPPPPALTSNSLPQF